MSGGKNVKVLLFGAAADLAGKREIGVSVAADSSLDELWEAVVVEYPRLSPMRQTLAFAVNGEYAEKGAKVSPGDEVAFLPPVSGG
ncbi:MAG: MoaD/ThiS family protein [Rubrobacter sp.]|jgi:molybdopterin converting factor subunit 1|nr:MoaD/ThiS family protein [Rubrobacter sp.]